MSDVSFVSVVEEVLKLKGLDILLSQRLFAACLTDIGEARHKKMIGLVSRNIDDQTLSILHKAATTPTESLDVARKRVETILHDDMGIASEIAAQLAYDLSYAVGNYCGQSDLLPWSEIEQALVQPFTRANTSSSAAPSEGGADLPDGSAGNHSTETIQYAVYLDSFGRNKIATIKVYRDQTGASLAEAKRAIEAAPTVLMQSGDKASCERFVAELNGVGATARLQQRASVGERSAQNIAPQHLNVVLEASGGNKIDVIKALRGQTGLSLAEAKYVVESSPCTIRSTTDEIKCGAIAEALRAAGASVHVESSEERCCAYYDNPSTTEDRAKAFGATIPILMKYLRLSYGDAERIMGSAPCGVVRCMSKSLADNMVSEIHAAGGRVPKLTKIEFFPLAPSLSRGIPFADNII